MRTSVIVAGTLAIGATAWILSGQFGATDKRAAANGPQNTETQAEKPLSAVRVRVLKARIKQDALIERQHRRIPQGHASRRDGRSHHRCSNDRGKCRGGQ
jgi:hypothetical protein